MAGDPRLWDADPQIRLAAWHELARAHINADIIDSLAGHGLTEAARGLAAATGTPANDRGAFLGRLESWGLDVYAGSPRPWIDALMNEQESRHRDGA